MNQAPLTLTNTRRQPLKPSRRSPSPKSSLSDLNDKEAEIAYNIGDVFYSSDSVMDWMWAKRQMDANPTIRNYILNHEDPYISGNAWEIDRRIDSLTNSARNNRKKNDENLQGSGLTDASGDDYCVAKCKSKTKNVGEITTHTSKNNRRMRRSTCGTCGSTKSRVLASK